MKKKIKICSMCKQEKSIKEFSKHKYFKDELDPTCRSCKQNRVLNQKYNISKKQYQILFDAQKGCCAICEKHQSKFKRALHVDHNHKTNIIRGLLCYRCNIGLGFYKKRKKAVKKYLKEAPQRMIKIYKQWLEIEK